MAQVVRGLPVVVGLVAVGNGSRQCGEDIDSSENREGYSGSDPDFFSRVRSRRQLGHGSALAIQPHRLVASSLDFRGGIASPVKRFLSKIETVYKSSSSQIVV